MDAFRYLLSRPDINVTLADGHGATVLHLACQYASNVPVDAFKLLVDKCDDDVINARDRKKQTPLHHFSEHVKNFDYCMNMFEYLLSRPGIDVTFADINGDTVLHCACRHVSQGSFEWIELLIENCLNKITTQSEE